MILVVSGETVDGNPNCNQSHAPHSWPESNSPAPTLLGIHSFFSFILFLFHSVAKNLEGTFSEFKGKVKPALHLPKDLPEWTMPGSANVSEQIYKKILRDYMEEEEIMLRAIDLGKSNEPLVRQIVWSVVRNVAIAGKTVAYRTI